MTTPVRLQLSRRRGFNLQRLSMETNGLPAVNVARPSRWGNPFRIGEPPPAIYRHMEFNYADTRKYLGGNVIVADAAEAMRLFKCYAAVPSADPLRGHNLACWCALDQPCHGAVLLELAAKGE